MFDEGGQITEEFRTTELPELLGDKYYNDPETKQQPTKIFDNINDKKTFVNSFAESQRKISAHGEELKNAVKGMVKVPGEGSTDDEVKAFRKAIGVPDSKDGYQLTIPTVEDVNEKTAYETIAGEVKEAAFAEGIQPSKLGKVWDKVINALIKRERDLEQKGLDMMAEDERKQREKYREKYDPFMKSGDDALMKFKSGVELGNVLKKMGIYGHPIVREFLAEVAPLVLEGGTHFGGGIPSETTPKSSTGFSYEYDEHGKPK